MTAGAKRPREPSPYPREGQCLSGQGQVTGAPTCQDWIRSPRARAPRQRHWTDGRGPRPGAASGRGRSPVRSKGSWRRSDQHREMGPAGPEGGGGGANDLGRGLHNPTGRPPALAPGPLPLSYPAPPHSAQMPGRGCRGGWPSPRGPPPRRGRGRPRGPGQ